jgi:dimeric dUTPase (all-alpha-NTP-PPase superfamily)
MQKQIQIMLEMQDAMNTKVHPEWRTQGFPWYRAIWVEAAEMMDHIGWKWWKKQAPDIQQIKLELVDIFHFGLSIYAQLNSNANATHAISGSVNHANAINPDNYSLLNVVEKFASHTLMYHDFGVELFFIMCRKVDLSFDELFKLYVGKNVLNFLRQDYGYKDGTYRKNWYDGREDNAHLSEVLELLDSSSETYQKDVYAELIKRYLKSSVV